jgi:hypothetical protein
MVVNKLIRIPVGENYENIKKANIRPFNITDLKKKTENEEDQEENYFTIDIKVPSGR